MGILLRLHLSITFLRLLGGLSDARGGARCFVDLLLSKIRLDGARIGGAYRPVAEGGCLSERIHIQLGFMRLM